MFNNTFPDVTLALTFGRKSLLAAAEGRQPEAAVLFQRLQQDKEYFAKVIPLVRSITSEMLRQQH
jgi:hypothetical protein